MGAEEGRRERTGTSNTKQESEESTLMRKREQAGTIYRKGDMWYLRYSDDRVINGAVQRKRLARQLGSVAEMTKKKAAEEARLFLTTINRPTLPAENALKLTAFVDSVYFPRIEQ